MKKILLFFCIMAILISFLETSFSQDITQIGFLSELDNKKTATYGDALGMFKIQEGALSSKKKDSGKEAFLLKGYENSAPLTKGMAALMTARYLDLGGSFMYLIFKTERYAFMACIANGMMNSDGGENDKMSGPELIELFSKISERKGGE